jgi:hypothetical protein
VCVPAFSCRAPRSSGNFFRGNFAGVSADPAADRAHG